MPDYHAFVSHSFLDQDAPVVEKFIKLFNHVEALHPQFKWDHAIRAEPRSLSEKVIRVFQDKNTLIAICTKREQVYVPSRPTAGLWGLRLVADAELTWKTSDWILQEIGFAKGRDLTLIVFLENGVVRPAGITSDLQTIPFDRANPEAAYADFMEMIASLNPITPNQGSIEKQPQTVQPPEIDQQPGPGKSGDGPQSNWGQADYDRALLLETLGDHGDTAQEIYLKYKESPLFMEPKNQARWDAQREFFIVLAEKSSSLQPLLNLSRDNPDNAQVWDYLGRAYAHLEMNRQAAEAKEKAAELENSLDKKNRLWGEAAALLAKAGNQQGAARILRQMIDATSADTESSALEALQRYFGETKELEFQIAALEVLRERDPLDADIRFSLGYQYDALDENRAALLHYLGVPEHKRAGGAWNNLGFAREKLSLPIGTIGAYRRAIDAKEPIAFSNLAKRYSSAGFIREALQVCDEGLTALPGENDISDCKALLESQREAETKREEAFLKEARPISETYAELGKAMLRRSTISLPMNWKGPKCDLLVTISGDRIAAEGEFTEQPSGLASAIAGRSSSPPAPLPVRIEYEGVIRGRAVVGSVQQQNLARSTLLGSWSPPTPLLMFIRDDGRTIDVIEEPRGGKPKRYQLQASSVT
ncbi:tetratricopeptide repeat protein [uncultured Reyranella sp.]|uniref:tetratricopeptide repeat protein n=1 Tax=uncultured Reyranella sp. TaxID=735512 RepID=UPI0025F70FA8|nr:tetratricopeptide repeat protein [uncultured Reyranella sp.]